MRLGVTNGNGKAAVPWRVQTRQRKSSSHIIHAKMDLQSEYVCSFWWLRQQLASVARNVRAWQGRPQNHANSMVILN